MEKGWIKTNLKKEKNSINQQIREDGEWRNKQKTESESEHQRYELLNLQNREVKQRLS